MKIPDRVLRALYNELCIAEYWILKPASSELLDDFET